MAEILLSLTIIGIVAAITLPSLTGNINERTWNTQRKALYARFSQALALMPSLNGYGTLTAELTNEDGSITQSAQDNAAETFLTEGLSKVLKINNICDSDHLADCGIPSAITPLNGGNAINLSDIGTLQGFNSAFNDAASIPSDIKSAAFETQNGESIIVYYNPNCIGDLNETVSHRTQPKMCANFVYDLNGNKGPNTVGKDIGFITALYPTDPVIVAPQPLATGTQGGEQTVAGENCQKQDSENRLPNRDELTAMFYNRKLVGMASGDYWSGSVISSGESGTAWYQEFSSGTRFPLLRSRSLGVWCVKR